MMIFCTLFDSNYLDKGIVMYRSLLSTGCTFKMYILAMDNKCKEVLDKYEYKNLTTISLDDFVDKMGLFDVWRNRSRAEFCWTCTSYLIDYVLNMFNEPICTYVDSDLFFYSNPQCLIDEMGDKTVQIVEHRFDNSSEGKIGRSQSGTYCVEFNTFKNTSDALVLLKWWEERCYESCSIDRKTGNVFGDQGYLEHWENNPCVSVLKNLGGGVAPWNVNQYKLVSKEENNNRITLVDQRTKKTFQLVFYHFHNIIYYDAHKANINVYGRKNIDDSLVEFLYIPYLMKLNSVKTELKTRFNVYPLLTAHPGFENRKEKKKKSLIKSLKSIDNLIIPKIYVRTIGKFRRKRDAKKNVIFIGKQE